MNEATFKLYTILASSPNRTEARLALGQQFNLNLNQEQFDAVVAQSLGGYNVLADDDVPRKAVLRSYLKLKVEIFPAWLVRALSKPLQWLYEPSVFWAAFLLCASVVLMVYLANSPNHVPMNIDYDVYFGLLWATMIAHELGHIGACARYGLKHGGIGFGFYFIMPVMYADITGIWLASKSKRIIANLAGIFNEVLYAATLAILFLITDNETYLAVALTVVTLVVWQFNPFVRFDGYWVLSDLTNTPNLLQKANATFKRGTSRPAIKAFFKRPAYSLKQVSLRDKSLFAYGFLNMLLWGGIMVYTLIVYRATVIQFPAIVWHLLEKTVEGQIAWEDFSRKYLTVFLFYVLLIRLIIKKMQRIRIPTDPSAKLTLS